MKHENYNDLFYISVQNVDELDLHVLQYSMTDKSVLSLRVVFSFTTTIKMAAYIFSCMFCSMPDILKINRYSFRNKEFLFINSFLTFTGVLAFNAT